MNDRGVYNQPFTVVIGGLGKLPNIEIVVPEKDGTITLKPSDFANSEGTVQIRNTNQDLGGAWRGGLLKICLMNCCSHLHIT